MKTRPALLLLVASSHALALHVAPLPVLPADLPDAPFELTAPDRVLRALAQLLSLSPGHVRAGCRIVRSAGRHGILERIRLTHCALGWLSLAAERERLALLQSVLSPEPEDGVSAAFINITKAAWLLEAARGSSRPAAVRRAGLWSLS